MERKLLEDFSLKKFRFLDFGFGFGEVVNREALWQVLRMYDLGVKLLREIKSILIVQLVLG